MAIIYSYPIATPKSKDLLVGTSVFDENDPSSERTNPTVSFTVQSLINLIGPIIGTPNLQQVTGAGNTTTNSITIANSLSVNGSYIDSYGQSGSDGQVLTSQGTGTQTRWLASTGGVNKIIAGDRITINPTSGLGDVTITADLQGGSSYQAGAGLTLDASTTPDAFKVDYLGTDNIILSAGTAVTPVGGDTIIINDATTGNVVKALISNLPFDTYNKWVLTGDSGTQDILSGNTVDIAGGTYITTAASATDTLTINHDLTSRTSDTDTSSPAFGADINVFDTLTTNATGHVTVTNLKTITLPSPVDFGSGSAPAATAAVGTAGYVPAPAAGTGSASYFLNGLKGFTIPPDTKLTTITTSSGTVSTGTPLTGSIDTAGEVLTITSKYFGGGSNIGYVPANTDGTQFLRGDGNWASIPTGLNYEGVWEAGTIAEVATQSGTNLTITTAPTQTLVVGMRVTGTGINPGTTVLISSVTSQTEVVVDTSISIAPGVQVTFSTAGGFPDLTVAGTQGDGILYICTVQGFASPNDFGTPPSFWNVGDWCVYSGTAGSGEWTRVPATNAGVTSFTSDFTFPGAGSPPQFISGNTLSGVAGAVDIGRINLSATATSGNIDSGKYLRGDNKWDTRITEVQGTNGLTGGSAVGGNIAISPQYDTEGNIILSSYPGDPSVTTTAGSGGSTTLTFSTDDAAKIFAGMQVLQIGAAAWVVSSVNYLSGVVTFVGNVTPDPGVGATVDFTAVLTGTSQMIFNAGTGASISEFVSHKAVSTVGLSLFLNDAGFLTSAVTSITGQEPISIYTANPYSATSPRIDLNYDETGTNTDDNVVTAADSAGADTLADSDLFLAADISTATNKVKKFTMTRLKSYIQLNTLTGVTAGAGLDGGGSSGNVTVRAQYETDANIVKASNFNNSSTTTVTGGSTSQTQITISAAAAANVKPGMIAGTSALSNNIGTVSVNDLTGLITFANNLGVTVGTGDTVYFSSVLFSGSELMFSTSGEDYVAGTNTLVTTLPLSRIDLNLFDTTNLPGSTVFTPAVLNPLTIGIKGQVPAPPTTTASNPTGYFLRSNATWGHAISSLLTGDGLKGGPISQSGTVSVEYSGELIFNTPLNNVITSANSLIIPGGDYIDTTDLILISDTTNSISATSNGAVTAGTAVTLTVDQYTPTGINIEAGLNIYDASGANAYYGVVTAASTRLSFTCNLDTDIADGVDLIFRNNTEVKKALVSQLPFVPSGTSFISTVTADNGLKIGGTSSNPIVEASYTKAEFEVNGAAATNQKTFTLTIALTGIDGATVKNIAGQTIGVVDSVSGFTVTCVANLAFAVVDGEILTFSTKPKNLITAAPPDALGILAVDEMLVLSAASGLVERKPIGDLPGSSGTTNLGYTGSTTDGTVTSSTGTNATLPLVVAAGNAGLMTGADKTKLNGIAAGAQVNVGTDLSKTTSTTNVTINSSTGTNVAIGAATTSVAGVMTKALYDNVILNNAKVTDSGIPAILSDGTLNRTAALIRSDIGAGTSSTVGTLTGITAGVGIEVDPAAAPSPTVKVDYGPGTGNIITLSTAGPATPDIDPAADFFMYSDTSDTKTVKHTLIEDLPFASSSASGTVTSISASKLRCISKCINNNSLLLVLIMVRLVLEELI